MNPHTSYFPLTLTTLLTLILTVLTPRTSAAAEPWQTYEIANIKLNLPGQPQKVPQPAQVQQAIATSRLLAFEAHMLTLDQGATIGISRITFPGLPDVKAAMQNSVQELKKMPPESNLKIDFADTQVTDKISGTKMLVQFDERGQRKRATTLYFTIKNAICIISLYGEKTSVEQLSPQLFDSVTPLQ